MSTAEKNYQIAKEQYAEFGVDTDKALELLKKTPISVHCWQINDLSGLEDFDSELTGGIQAIGDAPGKPHSREEYMTNLVKALDCIPGATKLALHAIYPWTDDKPERNMLEPKHFAGWVDFAKEHNIGLDMNPTYFSHPMSDSGWTLASPDKAVRDFWIEHGKCCRKIGEYFGRELGQPCITNHWIGDGMKDYTADTLGPRLRLKDSLDQIFAEPIDRAYNIDSVESKLFGLGSEYYVPGSHEFYTNYVMSNHNCIMCMDAGHFHPTEQVSMKISSYIAFGEEMMLHVSRPVRWDSDHVVSVYDETKQIMEEIVKCDALDKVHIGLDFFDASIERIAATVIGARDARKCLMLALLNPVEELKKAEAEGNYAKRLALHEEAKTLPAGLVWDYFCETEGVPGREWVKGIVQ